MLIASFSYYVRTFGKSGRAVCGTVNDSKILSKTSINVRVRDQHKCHLSNFATVTDYDALDITRGRFIGGLSVLRYFRTVSLWTPVSLVIALMDRPLRFAA